MKTPKSVRIVAVIMLLAVAVSAGIYLLQRRSAAYARDEADIHAIYHVVGEFGARLKDVPDSSETSLALLIKEKGVGVRVVAGKRVLHTADGRDLIIAKWNDGKETVSIHEHEAMDIQDALDIQYDAVRHEMSAITTAGIDANLKRLITDRLYREFTTYADVVPGKPASGPYPEAIRIDSLQKVDDTSYTVKANIFLMTDPHATQSGNAGETPVTLTLKKVNGAWLIDDVAVGTQPSA
jgi:hypothetical protein